MSIGIHLRLHDCGRGMKHLLSPMLIRQMSHAGTGKEEHHHTDRNGSPLHLGCSPALRQADRCSMFIYQWKLSEMSVLFGVWPVREFSPSVLQISKENWRACTPDCKRNVDASPSPVSRLQSSGAVRTCLTGPHRYSLTLGGRCVLHLPD